MLTQIQRVLALLVTDRAVRQRFFADPQSAGEALGLSPDEARQLAQLSAPQVQFFARSLHAKRLNEAGKLLPLTRQVLGQQFPILFRRHAYRCAPAGARKPIDDAMAFAAFLEQLPCSEMIDFPWVVELARYEAAWLKAADPGCRWVVHCFRYPIHHLVQTLKRQAIEHPRRQPMIGVWFRLKRTSRLRYLPLLLPRRCRDSSLSSSLREGTRGQVQ